MENKTPGDAPARKAAHTPGPWEWDNGYSALPGVDPFPVLLIGDTVIHAFDELKDEDASLIAAAPDLYAALAQLVGDLDRIGEAVQEEARQELAKLGFNIRRHERPEMASARAALAKARGEQA